MLKKTTKKKRNPTSKSKQKSKRLKTFHDSNCSLLEDPLNPASISDLFKNQAIKKKQPIANPSQINFNSTINNYTSVYTVISSIHPQKPEKTKSSKNISKLPAQGQKKKAPQKGKSKSKLVTEPNKQTKKKKQLQKNQPHKLSSKLQSYQLIPPSKNSLNSEIVFSTQQTKRESQWQQKRRQQSSRIYDSLTRISQQNLVNNNKLLRSTIKQQFKRKNQAATKIQKVFRGYLTRKILQKYIRQQQQKLYGLLSDYKSSSGNNNNKPLSSNRQQQKSKRSHNNDMQFFSCRTKSLIQQQQYSPKTFQDQQSINLSKINPSHYRLEDSKISSERMSNSNNNRFFNDHHNHNYNDKSRQNDIVNCEDEVESSDEENDQTQEQQDNQDEKKQNHQSEQQSCSDDYDRESQSSQQIIAYRHQQVIYNGAQIQQYLESSSDQDDNHHQKLPQMIAEDQIIFETNQEHIQSRKNSLLNKDKPTKKYQQVNQLTNYQPSNIIFYQQNDQPSNNNFNHPQQQSDHFMDQDLIKTSKVSSIHNHSQSQKISMKSSQTVSPRTKKQMINYQSINELQQPSQRTSKKQCKKVISIKKPLNISVQSQHTSIQSSQHLTSLTHHQSNVQHLNTIKLSVTQKYSPPNLTSKQAFMDTVSYNSQFKAKHQINTSQQQVSKRKNSMKKKKIYYFSDQSDNNSHVDNDKQLQSQESSSKHHHGVNSSPSSSKRNNNSEQNHNNKYTSPSELERLKNLQMQRWDEVIKLMNCQLKGMTQGPSRQFQCFIKQVMELSLKNKQILKDMISQQQHSLLLLESSGSKTFKNSRIDQILEGKDSEETQEKLNKYKDFKQTLSNGRRKSITEQDIAIFKPNSRIILSNKQAEKHPPLQKTETNFLSSPKSKPFFMQPKQQLKQKLHKLQQQNFTLSQSQTKQFTLMNIQNDQIQQMLKIRQEMLQKRQCEQLTKLNQKLIKKQTTQKQFLKQLKQLTDVFQLQKLSIDKARQDIAKGYNAAVKLIKQAFCDAKKIGYKLPLSKSSDSYKLNKHLGFGVLSGLNNVIIDQLNVKDQSSLLMMKHVVVGRDDHEDERKNVIELNDRQNLSKKQRLMALEVQYIEPKQFTRSNPSQPLNILSNNNSNNFSQSSQSIINNLIQSHTSLKDQQCIQAEQISPKPPQTIKTPESSSKSNIFTGNNDHSFDDMSEQSSQIEFSEEELKRFRKAQPYDPSIADMNRNLMIGKDFFEMQKFSHELQFHNSNQKDQCYQDDPQNLRMRLYRQVYEIEQNSTDSMVHEFYHSKPKDPKTDLIAQKQLEFLIFEMASQLLMKPLFSQKFLQPKRQQMFGIRKVSDQCRKDFIKMVQNLMPQKQQIFTKINQNISPLPKQLLKCMRIDFSQDQQQQNDQQYEQIGKYQMILDQDMCNLAIDKYHQKITSQKQNKLQIQLLTGQNISSLKQQFSNLWSQPIQQKVFVYLQQRQKFVSNRKQHCQSIRWQFINMQLHCLFDAWNQQIIQLKNNHNGFSGIGLNQLTLSMIDRNRKVKQTQVQQIIQLSKFKLMKLLNYQQDIINEINTQVNRDTQIIGDDQSRESGQSLKDKIQQSWQKFSWVYTPNKDIQEQLDTQEESRWVYYADQALSYGLELVYLIEEELFGQLAKDLRKLTLKGQFV